MSLSQRPYNFRVKYDHPLAQGLVFAGLGAHAGSKRYHDSSVFWNTGTLTNMDPATDWVWDSTLNRYLLDFDGSNDVVLGSTSTVVTNTAMSVSLWANLRTIGGAAADMFATKSNADHTAFAWQFVTYDNPSNNIALQRAGNHYRISDNGSALTGIHHYCATSDGTMNANGIRLYVDGKECSYASAVLTDPINADSTNYNLRFGNRGDGARPLDGMEGDQLIHSRVLTIHEIRQLADPSNVMLSGMLEPPKRQLYTISYHPVTEAAFFARVCFAKRSTSSVAGIKVVRRTV